jgi:hypothetical protein
MHAIYGHARARDVQGESHSGRRRWKRGAFDDSALAGLDK